MPTHVVRNQLIDAEEPWDGQEAGESPECEPLKYPDKAFRKMVHNLRWKWQGDDHHGEEDAAHDREEDHVGDSEELDAETPFALRFRVDLGKAVEECKQPKKPLKQCREHDGADNGDVDDVLNWPGCGTRSWPSGRLLKSGSPHRDLQAISSYYPATKSHCTGRQSRKSLQWKIRQRTSPHKIPNSNR